MNYYLNLKLITKAFLLIMVFGLFSCKNPKKSDSFEKAFEQIKKQDKMIALNLDSIKSQYGDKFMELREIINKHDPIGLIEMGAPIDEYEPEVKTILVQINDKDSLDEIHSIVYNEFIRWFGDSSTTGPKESYFDLAKDINNWKTNK